MENNQIVFSVIVPAYNLEKYIEDCIGSVLCQSIKNIELILIDDCSNDHTKNVIKEYIEREASANIILLENEKNEDAGYSRNRGLDIAKGEYLLFLDGDDMLEYNALERLYGICKETKADIVNYNYYSFDNNTHEKVEYNSSADALVETGQIFEFCDVSDCAFQCFRETAWDKVFRRKFIQKNGIRFQCQGNANDQLFVYSAMLIAKKIVKISDCLLKYRINRENQLSTSGNISRNPRCIWRATKATLDYIEYCGLYDLYQKSFLTYAVWRLIFSLKNVDAREAENLMSFYKEEGFKALKLADCNMNDFSIPYFFAVYNWLNNIRSVKELEKIENRNLWDNSDRWNQLFGRLMKEKKIILWGAGINGRKFLEKACLYKLDIKHIVDIDEKKRGQVICGHEIEGCENVKNEDLIISLNCNHISTIRHIMTQQKKKVKIFDACAYIYFEIDYEQAKVKAI